MKKLFFLAILLMMAICMPMSTTATTAQSDCGQSGVWQAGASLETSNCSEVNLWFVTIVTGSVTSTTTYTNALTGATCENSTTTDCSSGNRWQWFWE